jgi:protein gp37
VAAQRKAGVSAIHLHPERLDAPLHWKKPRRIFVNSMSDLFHEDVPDEFIDRIFAAMVLAPQHIYQVLTKRPERMLRYTTQDGIGRVGYIEGIAKRLLRERGDGSPVLVGKTLRWPFPHVWLGVSVENQCYADERLPLLAQCPAAVRFVSAEPLLSAIDLRQWIGCVECYGNPARDIVCGCGNIVDPTNGRDSSDISWVIIGGESDAGHRPMDLAWVQSIADQCAAVRVPVWVKQDSGLRPGQQGRLPDSLWALKEMPGHGDARKHANTLLG